MNIILLSGGSGKRLWPLSNEVMSKQFLKLLRDDDGNSQSMIQRVFGQIRKAGLNASVTIAASKLQADSIKLQVGDQADIVLEPERRNTFPAIVLSCARLSFEKGIDPEDVVIVLPVDPYAELHYFELMRDMERAIMKRKGDIVLMGVKPTYPSAKFGYIIPDREGKADQTRKVLYFREKPDEDAARDLIERGALWNCGVFAFKLGFLIGLLGDKVRVSSYRELVDRYGELPNESFDYEVLEKAGSVAVVEYDGVWKDLGTWNTLTEQIEDTRIGKNIIMDDTCKDTHVINTLDIPLITMGARDMVVVASHDGILVADKHQSSYLKPFADRIKQRPMYEACRWGEYHVLEYASGTDKHESMTLRVNILEGSSLQFHSHQKRIETWIATKGDGECLIDGQRFPLSPGSVLRIPSGCGHALHARTNLEIIEVRIGEDLSEQDTDFFDDDIVW